MQTLGAAAYDAGRFPEAIDLFNQVALAETYAEFLTLPAYAHLD